MSAFDSHSGRSDVHFQYRVCVESDCSKNLKAMGWTPPHLNGIYVPNWRFDQPIKRKKESTMKIIRVGVDLAKNVFQAHGVDRNEKPVWKRKLKREEWLKVLQEKVEPGCEIGMEACGAAHHWARKLQALGYRVKL